MSQSELATVDLEELAIPGAFDPTRHSPLVHRSKRQVPELTHMRRLRSPPHSRPLVVVLVIIGRHMVLQARECKAYEVYKEDLEAQDAGAKLLDEEEVNEEVGLVDPAGEHPRRRGGCREE